MKMDWKIIAAAMALVVILSVTIFVQVSLAAGGSGSTTGSIDSSSNKSLAGSKTQVGKNQTSKANNTSASGKADYRSQVFVPGGGPHGTGLKIDNVGPHQKGWMGGPMNPWVYGPSAYPGRMIPYGLGAPVSYLGASINK